MARIDVKTLVLAFEKRISELEKNPPDKISTGVIINLLENGIEECIREHFIFLVKNELEGLIKKEFMVMKSEFIVTTLENIFHDEEFRENLENSIKKRLIGCMM
jgi:hypothetical protein